MKDLRAGAKSCIVCLSAKECFFVLFARSIILVHGNSVAVPTLFIPVIFKQSMTYYPSCSLCAGRSAKLRATDGAGTEPIINPPSITTFDV